MKEPAEKSPLLALPLALLDRSEIETNIAFYPLTRIDPAPFRLSECAWHAEDRFDANVARWVIGPDDNVSTIVRRFDSHHADLLQFHVNNLIFALDDLGFP